MGVALGIMDSEGPEIDVPPIVHWWPCAGGGRVNGAQGEVVRVRVRVNGAR